MAMTPTTRLPLAPLAGIVRGTEPMRDQRDVGMPRRIADACGFHVRQVLRWYEDGGIPYYQADAAACALGLHPTLIWPDYLNTPDYVGGYVHPSVRDLADHEGATR